MTTDDAGAAEPALRRRRRQRPLWQEFLVILVVATGLAVLVKTLLLQAFYIPSESMEPGLVRNDRILVQKVSYELGGSPERGDVVVFTDPGDWLPPEEAAGPTGTVAKVMERIGLYPSGGHLVKRVIGVAGDTIRLLRRPGPPQDQQRRHRRARVRAGGRGPVLRPDDRRLRLDGGAGA